ncbi:hypothetical protein Hanom_Chr16g01484181 [Helianthus anomalus]
MAMGICRQGSLSGGELGREIPSAVRGTVQLPFFFSFGRRGLRFLRITRSNLIDRRTSSRRTFFMDYE